MKLSPEMLRRLIKEMIDREKSVHAGLDLGPGTNDDMEIEVDDEELMRYLKDKDASTN